MDKLLIQKGETPKTGETISEEAAAELLSGSPLEEKVEEILGKMSNIETSIEKISTLFEKGGIFSGFKK